MQQTKMFLSSFYNIRKYINREHIRIIYYEMIYSRIVYGSVVYGLTSDANLDKIQIMQNKLLKVISSKPYRFSTNKLHNDFFYWNLKTLLNKIFCHLFITMFIVIYHTSLITILNIDIVYMISSQDINHWDLNIQSTRKILEKTL